MLGQTRFSSSPLVTRDPSAASKTSNRSNARVPSSIGPLFAEQLPPAQQHPKSAEFEHRFDRSGGRPTLDHPQIIAARPRCLLVRLDHW
jgi:hypothetical protein